MLTLTHHSLDLASFTLADVQAYRDEEWMAREHAYHTVAVDELNSLVRKYNGLAPYSVRRPYHVLAAELDRVYLEAGRDVLSGLAESARQASGKPAARRGPIDDEEGGPGSGGGQGPDGHSQLGIWDVVVGWFRGRKHA
jgi:DnaJ family protein C protein 28